MTYQDKQRETIRAIEQAFQKGEAPSTIVEPLENYSQDNQMCLTGVAFPPKDILGTIIESAINPLRKEDERQYFYLPESLHLTVQNVRTINNPPLFSDEDIEKAKEVFRKVVPKHKKISLQVKEIFELPTSLALCVYSNESFKDLVAELRAELVNGGVPDNKKYASEIVIGNITFCRFTTKPTDELTRKVKELKNINIGEFTFDTVSLITTNAVCTPEKTTSLGEYALA